MAAAAATTASILSATRSASTSAETPSASNRYTTSFRGTSLRRYDLIKRRLIKSNGRISAAATVATASVEQVKEYALPTWAQFDLGRAPVYWKTMNGLLPSSGERLRIFYNPAANKLTPNEEFGIAFNGGFNQPIMCGGEPRVMLQKTRGQADPPLYTIQICIPKHAHSLIFSFTNGTEWDGPYRLQFQVPKPWRNKPIEFFTEALWSHLHVKNRYFLNQGLAEELSKDGACDRAIFPDANTVITTCAVVGNLTIEGGDRCNLNLVPGCTDPSSPLYDPLANVDDGSCPPYSDSED